MLAKISAENVKAIGGENAAEFNANLSTFIAEANQAKTFMSENQTTISALEKRIEALEGKIVTEARVTELVNTGATSAVSTWAASDAGKKIIGGESSRIAMEALANVGTQPAKPSPAPTAGNDTPEAKAAALNAEGKFEEAWKLDKRLQAEFSGPKSYAAFMRASNRGAVKVYSKTSDFDNNN